MKPEQSIVLRFKTGDGNMPAKAIAYCGLICNEDCPAFSATQRDDHVLLQKTAERWSHPDYVLDIQDVLCDGCTAEGKRLAAHCSDCGVRACAKERELANCALCAEYPCAQLINLWGVLKSPQARDRLDQFRMESSISYF